MAVQFFSEEALRELLRETELSRDVAEPRRCEHCEGLMVPRIDQGRVLFECRECEPTPE